MHDRSNFPTLFLGLILIVAGLLYLSFGSFGTNGVSLATPGSILLGFGSMVIAIDRVGSRLEKSINANYLNAIAKK